jgi:hypothetical protein
MSFMSNLAKWCQLCLIVSFVSNHAIHVKSCRIMSFMSNLAKSCQLYILWQIMSFVSNHAIHVKSCRIISFMSNHVIHVKSCLSCQIMSFMSNHVIHIKSCWIMSNHVIHVKSVIKCVIIGILDKVRWGGWGGLGQIVLSRSSADSFAVGRRQKEEKITHIFLIWLIRLILTHFFLSSLFLEKFVKIRQNDQG